MARLEMFGNPRLDVDLLRDSFVAMEPIIDRIAEKFFEILRERHPQAELFFPCDRTEQDAQALVASLRMITEIIDTPHRLLPFLDRAGRYFACQGVLDVHYDWATEAMLRTFAHFFHIGWSHDLRKQWILAFAICANRMKHAARQLVPQTSTSAKKNKKTQYLNFR